jgi:hypothetical protein
LLWWWGIYLFFIFLDFVLMVGYLFVFHFFTYPAIRARCNKMKNK